MTNEELIKQYVGALCSAVAERDQAINALKAQVALEQHIASCYGCFCKAPCTTGRDRLHAEAMRLRKEVLGD